MSQRRLLPILACAIPVIKNKNQIRGHQRLSLISAKSADVVKIENVTAQNDIHSQKSGQGYPQKLMNVYWEKIDRQAPSSDRRHDGSYG